MEFEEFISNILHTFYIYNVDEKGKTFLLSMAVKKRKVTVINQVKDQNLLECIEGLDSNPMGFACAPSKDDPWASLTFTDKHKRVSLFRNLPILLARSLPVISYQDLKKILAGKEISIPIRNIDLNGFARSPIYDKIRALIAQKSQYQADMLKKRSPELSLE